MEEKKENIISHAMRSGLKLGASFSLLNILQMLITSSFLNVMLSAASFLLIFFALFRFTQRYDEEVLGGTINYSEAFKYGAYMFFFGGMIFAVTTFTFYSLFPDVLQTQIEALKATSTLLLKGGAEYDEAIKAIQAYTVKDITFSSFSGFVFLGLFTALFTSFRFRSTNKVKNL